MANFHSNKSIRRRFPWLQFLLTAIVGLFTAYGCTRSDSQNRQVAAATTTVYVTNSCFLDGQNVCAGDSSGTISVLKLGTPPTITTIPVEGFPGGIAVSADGQRIYVASQNSRSISVIDTANNSVVANIPIDSVPEGPRGIALSPNGLKAYVTNGYMLGASGYGGGPPYLKGSVSVIDIKTNKVVGSPIRTGGYDSEAIVVSPDDQRVYVANVCGDDVYCGDNGTITVINAHSDRVITKIPMKGAPYGIAISSDGRHLYVANDCADGPDCNNGAISIIDTQTNSVTSNVRLPLNIQGLAISPDGQRLYVVAGVGCADSEDCSHGTLLILNALKGSITTTVPVGYSATSVAVSRDGKLVFVSNECDTYDPYSNACGTGTISVIDANRESLIDTVETGGYAPRSTQGITASGDH